MENLRLLEKTRSTKRAEVQIYFCRRIIINMKKFIKTINYMKKKIRKKGKNSNQVSRFGMAVMFFISAKI